MLSRSGKRKQKAEILNELDMNRNNPWNNRTAAVAIVIAFTVGIVGALSLRENRELARSEERFSRNAETVQ